ncbi:hypothetical protein P691DRAFT_762207 [Macrolepiota fuliginosa MF-IS2]|uniref:Shugoshin C-terminal domain-containing protein n=1 Tax=Macrolepiota fuliginosa MF-IS2 TaxID=1400762 RepID=A0A9P5X9C2_9AGAR|nr:hypothetical protein P691DRAFT_762207 [Macrolepiota fuliginosa MF-IS2]
MSRRDSRASIGVRQADALAEYENLKKKFLLANKHITKLNSTLSLRIEELNAEITVLQVENLRLRQSEISLLAQLKREREKSRKIMVDAETATLSLTKHLGYLRQSLNINMEPTPPSSPAFPPATKPPLQTTNACIPGLRIAKPPNVPGIHEEDEPSVSPSDSEHENKTSSGRRKSKAKPRLSASKLPLPPRATSPPTAHIPSMIPTLSRVDFIDSSGSTKRKSSRRQSGLLSIDTENLAPPRPASPAFGSPIRLEAGRAEEAEEIAVMRGNLEVEVEPEPELQDHELPPPVPKKERRKSKSKDRETEGEREREYAVDSVRSREKKRQREDDGGLPLEGTKGRLKDVTNSRAILQPINCNTVRDQEELVVSARTFLVPSSAPSSMPVQPQLPPESESEPPQGPGGRERRVRKSINYTEPKLNTKMRKPDPPPGTEPPRPKKRSSAAAIMSTATYPKVPEPAPLLDGDPPRRSSGEFLFRDTQGDAINPELYPLPPSRPQTAMYHSPIPPPRSSGTSSSSSSSGAVTGSLRRQKSKPLVESEGEESDGAQADGEYIPGGRLSAWVNVEGRTRKTGERTKKSGIVMLGDTRRELVDERRHSMAV